MDRKIVEKLQSLSEEDFLKYLETLPMDDHFHMRYCAERIMNLIDFIQVIAANKQQLKHSSSIALVKSGTKSVSPEQVLYDYIILEVSNFYSHAHICRVGGEILPEIPNYWEDLKEFRNAMPGHRDGKKELKTIKDWMSIHNKVDKITTTKIIYDFRNYYAECLKLWGDLSKN